MLYVTTRNEREYYPALRTLGQERGPDGGAYVPFRLPEFSREEVEALKDMSFGTCVARTLEKLFFPRLDGVELDFALGRTPVKTPVMSHRIAVAEMWHNIHWDFDWVVKELIQRLRTESQLAAPVTSWANIAVRIAVLFGVFGQLQRMDAVSFDQGMDVAVATGDFTMPMAAWYAREMGLPVGSVICCGHGSGIWDLLHRGEVRTSEPLPEGLERLIFGRLGAGEVERYLEICGRGGVYGPAEEKLELLRQGMFASVVSPRRIERTIASVYRTNSYILGPEAAVVYAGLQDYRATAGEGRLALLMAEHRPAKDLETVASALGMDPYVLKAQLD